MAFDYEYSPSRDRGSCSTIIVGKDASATGYVLVAHNEDDYDCVIQVHKVPVSVISPARPSALRMPRA